MKNIRGVGFFKVLEVSRRHNKDRVNILNALQHKNFKDFKGQRQR